MRFLPTLMIVFCLSVLAWAPAVRAATIDHTMLRELQADLAQQAGMTGQGITVGVISNGADGYQALQQSGDLPANISFADTWSSGWSEGAAMMELVHQIAPNASLAFCGVKNPNFSTVGACTQALVTNFHVNVVVDDMETIPTYGPSSDSYIDDALENANPALIIIHAAGNQQGGDFFAPFTAIPLAIAGTTYPVEDFGAAVGQASTPYETVTVPAGTQEIAYLKWNGNPTNPSSNNVMGVWILSQSGQVLASDQGTDPGGPTQASYTNNTANPVTVNMVAGLVTQNSNPQPLMVDFYSYPITEPINSPSTEPGQALGGSSSVWVTGAVNEQSLAVEPYSSVGPFLSYWSVTANGPESDGVQPLTYTALTTPETLDHPDFVGIDCAVITGIPTFYNSAPVFCGTSAASPTVAAVTALLLSAGYTKMQIRTALQETSKPVPAAGQSSTSQSPSNWDPNDGYGLVQAWAAAQYLGYLVPQPVINGSSSVSIQAGGNVNFTGSCTESGATISSYSWDFGNGQTSTLANPGNIVYGTAGSYTATFTCTDSKGHANPVPATVTVNVAAPQSQTPPPAKSGGGGGATDLLSLAALLSLWLIGTAPKRKHGDSK